MSDLVPCHEAWRRTRRAGCYGKRTVAFLATVVRDARFEANRRKAGAIAFAADNVHELEFVGKRSKKEDGRAS
jgi:hypothetical protein